MTGDHGPEAAHVDNATIEVGTAELYISPGARQAAHRLAWSLVVLFLFTIAGLAASLLFTSNQVHAVRANSASIQQQNEMLRRQVQADCGFYRDLAGLPLTNLPNGHPSELAVKIISDSRSAWFGHGCPGSLPAPSGTFIAGARFYHIPVVLAGN